MPTVTPTVAPPAATPIVGIVISELDVQLEPVAPGEDVLVGFLIKNEGTEPITTTVDIIVDGQVVESVPVINLAPGTSQIVRVVVTSDQLGTHTVRVGDLTATFTVTGVVTQTPTPTIAPPVAPAPGSNVGLIVGIIVVVLIAAGAGAYFLVPDVRRRVQGYWRRIRGGA